MSALTSERTVEAPRSRPGRTLVALAARDVLLLRRDLFTFLSRTIMQPLLFVFVFAYVLPVIEGGRSVFSVAGTSFSTVLLPGLLGTAMILSGIMAVTMPLIFELSYNREIEDRLLAPIRVELLAVEKIVWGAAQALLAALIVFPAVYFVHAPGQAPQVHVAGWPMFVVVFVFTALLSSSLGLYLGTLVDVRKINVIFAMITVPVTMLGCVYYPWEALHPIPWLQYVVLINPLVYASEGLRASLTPALPHMPAYVFVSVLVGGTLLFGTLAVRSFTRRVLA